MMYLKNLIKTNILLIRKYGEEINGLIYKNDKINFSKKN